MTNRTLIQKADLAIGDLIGEGGYLVAEQAAKFIQLLIKQSVLLPFVRVVPMNSPKRLLETIRFAGRVLKPGGTGALPVGSRTRPNMTKVELDSVEYKAEVRLPDNVLEDNIERGTLRNTVMQELGAAISRDLEFVVVNGDTTSLDILLKTQDGILKQIATNTFAHGAATNAALFLALLKKLPSEFMIRNRLMFFTSVKSELDWRSTLSNRQTQKGDDALTGEELIRFQNIKMLAIPEQREDIGGANTTVAIVTDPLNIAVGFQRQIQMETARDASAGETIIVATLRAAVKMVHEAAAAKGTGVSVV